MIHTEANEIVLLSKELFSKWGFIDGSLLSYTSGEVPNEDGLLEQLVEIHLIPEIRSTTTSW